MSSFSVNAVSGNLTTISLSTPTGTTPEDLSIHPSGRFLYTLSTGSNVIYMHSVSGSGALTALAPSTIATGINPKKIVVSPNGKYIFVSNTTDNTISIYSVNTSSGALTAIVGSPFAAVAGAGVYALAVTADNKYLVATGDANSKGYIYLINDASGSITQVGTEITLGANPRSALIVPLSASE